MFFKSRILRGLWALVTAFVVVSHGMDGFAPTPDRWFRDSVVMGSWVDAAWKTSAAKKAPIRKGALTWLHLGPTADCPHMLPVLPDFSCMDHWVRSSNDDDPELGIRWDSAGWGADILLYRLVMYSPPGADYGADSIEGPRVVGRLRVVATPADTSLEVIFRGRRSKMVRGELPRAYEGNIDPPDQEKDRLWFDSLHRAALAPVELVVPEPIRCLLKSHATRTKDSDPKQDTNCLVVRSVTQDSLTRTWSDLKGRWKVRRTFLTDTSDERFKDEIRFRFPDHWRWIWWERREAALKSALTFVTGTSPHRSPAMENPRLQFSTKQGTCHISGRSDHGPEPWFTLTVHCR